jgi:hypothetical protein
VIVGSGFAQVGHLARRFFGSLSKAEPAPADTVWALSWLTDGERHLFEQMSVADRRHAIGVTVDVAGRLGSNPPRWAMAASLLHDVGKLNSLGTWGRVAATLVPKRMARGAFDRYRRHPAIGSALLHEAQSDERTALWALEHHLPRAQWHCPLEVADVLKACDDD